MNNKIVILNKKIFLLFALSSFIITFCSCNNGDIIKNLDETNVIENNDIINESNVVENIDEETIPSALILTEEEKEFINNISNDEVEKSDLEIYAEYDEYIAKEKNISIEDAENLRMIDGLKIAISTTDNMMEITSFDIYTQIAVYYFVECGGFAKDIYDNCNNEEEVKTYLISNDNIGKLKLSTIINEHKFE